MEDWKEKYPEITIHMPEHIAGHRNIADLGTRGLAKVADIGPESEWQRGPSFLSTDKASWPISQVVDAVVPEEELLPRYCQAEVIEVNHAIIQKKFPILDNLRAIFFRSNNLQ